jgi:RHS repeat-associated protein
VSALVNAGDGTLLAGYEYGPFGEVIRQTSPMAEVNPVRFSTKYQDDESDLLMYVHRPYKASTGTWLSRDPIEENGFTLVKEGKQSLAKERFKILVKTRFRNLTQPTNRQGIHDINLYNFVLNAPLNTYDFLGLDFVGGTFTPSQYQQIQDAIKNNSDQAKKCAGNCPNKRASEAVAALSDTSSSVTINVATSSDKQCASGTCGYANLGDWTIVLCPSAFDSDQCGGLQCTLFHEILHAVGGMTHDGPNDPGSGQFNHFEKCMGCPISDAIP